MFDKHTICSPNIFFIYITFTCIIVIWFKVDINVGYTLSLNSMMRLELNNNIACIFLYRLCMIIVYSKSYDTQVKIINNIYVWYNKII